MADVFISYSSSERKLTEKLAKKITKRGYSVWWDTELLSGQDYEKAISDNLATAKAVIVIWTPKSVQSQWVKAEARKAVVSQKFIPLRLADLDADQIPMPYNVYHTDIVTDLDRIFRSLDPLLVSATEDQFEEMEDDDFEYMQYYERGLYHSENGDIEQAIAAYSNAIELKQDAPDLYRSRGAAYLELENYDLAIDDFSREIDLNPGDAIAYMAYIARGMAAWYKEDYDSTIYDMNQALELNPDTKHHAVIYSLRGASYAKRGASYANAKEYKLGIDDLDQAIELDPDNAENYFHRGWAYLALKKPKKALKDFKKMRKIHPDNKEQAEEGISLAKERMAGAKEMGQNTGSTADEYEYQTESDDGDDAWVGFWFLMIVAGAGYYFFTP